MSQTYANMFEIWLNYTSEAYVMVKDSVRSKAKAMRDSQTKAYCKHSTLFLFKNKQFPIFANS